MVECTIKCVVCGDANVGKTSLLDRLINDKEYKYASSTIGVECRVVTFPGIKEMRVRFWDTAGCERFDAITKVYYRGVDCALVCYNEQNPESLDHIEKWVDNIRAEHEGISKKVRKRLNDNVCCEGERYVEIPSDDEEIFDIPILLIATKCDTAFHTKTFETAEKIAETLHLQGPFYTSAFSMNKKQLQKILLPFFRTVHKQVLPYKKKTKSIEVMKDRAKRSCCFQ